MIRRSDTYWRRQYELDPEAGIHRSYQLYLTWNLKARFIAEAVRMNCFSSQAFYWIDAGYMRWPTPGNTIALAPRLFSSDRVTFLVIYPFQTGDVSAALLGSFHDRIAGNLFGGTGEAVTRWSSLYYQVFQHFEQQGWFVGKDQNLMNFLCMQHPDACNLLRPVLKPGENPWFTLWKCLIGIRTCLPYRDYSA